jgi:hypothetical protein
MNEGYTGIIPPVKITCIIYETIFHKIFRPSPITQALCPCLNVEGIAGERCPSNLDTPCETPRHILPHLPHRPCRPVHSPQSTSYVLNITSPLLYHFFATLSNCRVVKRCSNYDIWNEAVLAQIMVLSRNCMELLSKTIKCVKIIGTRN